MNDDDDDAEAEAEAEAEAVAAAAPRSICARNLILTSPTVPEMVSVIKLKEKSDPEPKHSR